MIYSDTENLFMWWDISNEYGVLDISQQEWDYVSETEIPIDVNSIMEEGYENQYNPTQS